MIHYGDNRGVRFVRGRDVFTKQQFAEAATGGNLDNLNFLIARGVVKLREDGLISQSQLAAARSNRALGEIRHRNDKAPEVQPLSGHRFRTPEWVSARTGVDARVILDLIAQNAFDGRVCPRTGAMHVEWSSFDRFWRIPANSNRARRLSQNLTAKESADAIAAANEKMTLDEQLAAANREANKWRDNLPD